MGGTSAVCLFSLLLISDLEQQTRQRWIVPLVEHLLLSLENQLALVSVRFYHGCSAQSIIERM